MISAIQGSEIGATQRLVPATSGFQYMHERQSQTAHFSSGEGIGERSAYVTTNGDARTFSGGGYRNETATTMGGSYQASSVNYQSHPSVYYGSHGNTQHDSRPTTDPTTLPAGHQQARPSVSRQIALGGAQRTIQLGEQFTSVGNTTGGITVGDRTTTAIEMQGHITGSYVPGENAAASYVSGSRTVTGEERVIGFNTIQQEQRVISERIVEHEVKVPKRIVREEVIEKVIIVPETITREEVVEEIQRITETIIEVARPVIHEKIVEVPEIEYRDKIVERVEKIQQEKIIEVPKIEYQERIVEVPKIIPQEKIVEVPEIEWREVIVEKVVEVPEIREQFVVKEVPVPQYVEKPVPEYRAVPQPVDIERNIPVPVEAITTFEYQLAQFRPRVNKIQYPLYVPRFTEVPVSAELFDEKMVAVLQAEGMKLQVLKSANAVSLCEVENLATEIRRVDATTHQFSTEELQTALMAAWKAGRVGNTRVTGVPSHGVVQTMPRASNVPLVANIVPTVTTTTPSGNVTVVHQGLGAPTHAQP